MLTPVLLALLGVAFVAGAVAWLVPKVNYRITSRHLEVRLFRTRLRRLALSDIRSISARSLRRHEKGEQWWNTLRPAHRHLMIRRRAGRPRYFVITPSHRYVFRTELQQAMAELKLPAPDDEDDGSAPNGTAAAP